MNIFDWIENKLSGWEKIDYVPKWINAYRVPIGGTRIFKGKHMIYQITHFEEQGHSHTFIVYRKKR